MFQGLFVPLHPLPKRDPWFVDFLTFWPLVPWGLWGFSNRTAGARLRGIHEFHTFHGTQIGTRVPLEMTILEKGSLLRNLCFAERLHQRANILGGTKQEIQEEAKKMQRFQPIGFRLSWTSTKIIQNSSPTCQLLQNLTIWWWFDILLLLGENPNLQNWSISKLSSFVTHQLRVLLHRSTRLQEGHIPTWDLLSYWDAHLWCASCNCKSWFSGKDDGCDYAKFLTWNGRSAGGL